MNRLADWMKLAGETDQSLAAKLGISRVHVSRLRRGKYRPSEATAKRLEALSGIPWASFVEKIAPVPRSLHGSPVP